jgi:methionyl-tRNA formyltransferase
VIRIAFFGLPLAALLLLRDGHDIPLACLSRPGWAGTRRLTRRLGPGAVLPKPDVTRDAFVDRVRDAKPDLVVSWFWTTRIPGRLLACAGHGGMGVHPSLLPRHRGPDPYYWTLASGDEQTGVTAHALDEEYDTGAILAQRRVHVDPAWDSWTLARKLDRPSLALLREVVMAFARGEPPKAVPQDESRATAAPSPTDEDLTVRWSEPSAVVVRRVRAASPWPGALSDIGDVPLVLTRVRETEDYPRALAPGEAVVRPDGIAVVRTGSSAVELLAGRDEDDQPLGAAALALLFRV